MLFKLFEWCVLVLPLLSLALVPAESLRRYLPVGLFVSLLNIILDQMGHHYQWWRVEHSIFPWSSVSFPLILGLFMVGTVWIFHFTYPRFGLFVLTNLLLDAFHAYIVAPILVRIGYVHFLRSTETWLFILMFGLSFVIYVFQKWYERDSLGFSLRRRDKIRV